MLPGRVLLAPPSESWGGPASLYHFDGHDWSEVNTGGHANVHAVWGTAEGELFFAGSAGMILHRPPTAAR